MTDQYRTILAKASAQRADCEIHGGERILALRRSVVGNDDWPIRVIELHGLDRSL